MQPFEIRIVVAGDGNLSIQSGAPPAITIGFLEIAKNCLLNPKQEPKVQPAPAGVLSRLNGS